MQLGDPSVLETSSGEAMIAAVTASAPAEESAATNGGADMEMMNNIVSMDATNSGDDTEKRSGGGGGNRWPRQETFALLKIRSDMDAAFRDSSLKGPLWEQVSRKLAELGYNRSAKKCKEKFENVYKYHKRTKESRSGKPEGKTYKFYDQLQALESQFTISHSHTPKPPPPPPPQPQQPPTFQTPIISYVPTVPSTINPTLITPLPPANITTTIMNPRNLPNKNLFSTTTSTSTSSSTASDEDMEEKYRKKRKLKDYFRRLTRQVLAKQEEMQKRFLEAIDKRESERAAQQEAWRAQEMARINMEHDILVQERSTAAAKDAAVITFLQKLSSGQQNLATPPPPPPPAPHPPAPPQPVIQVVQVQPPLEQLQLLPLPIEKNFEIQKVNNGHQVRNTPPSSSRWPQAEVHALIRLRTSLDPKYHENGPKGPLWEDISAGMRRLGYNRSAKRCKEKWENINKYFKKVKESNKRRREDSKTCPYFHELDAIYREKSKTQNNNAFNVNNPDHEMMMEPLMVQPEQQWRPPPPHVEGEGTRETAENMVQYEVKEGEVRLEMEEEEEDDDMEEDGDSGQDDQEGRYEMAATNNKLPSMDTVE